MPSKADSEFKLAVIILAAGRSRRMGRPKLLLPWRETSILGHQIAVWKSLGVGQICVVHATADEALTAELDRLAFAAENRIPNDHPQEGMFSSIRCAAAWGGWKDGVSHFAITLGDQPHVREGTLQAVLKVSRAQPESVCQPRYEGHWKHPAILPALVFRELAKTEASTLKEFLGGYEVAGCEVEDAGLELDIDTAEDYESALRIHQTGSSG